MDPEDGLDSLGGDASAIDILQLTSSADALDAPLSGLLTPWLAPAASSADILQAADALPGLLTPKLDPAASSADALQAADALLGLPIGGLGGLLGDLCRSAEPGLSLAGEPVGSTVAL